jgi:hypothetical protein
MFGFSFKVLAATFCILGISWLALDYFVPSPPPIITIATASKVLLSNISASDIGRDSPEPEWR